MHGRPYALPSDVKEIYVDATRHRVARSIRAQAENIGADEILDELLRAVPIS
jgi:MoxR-like ATPase